MTFFGFVFKGLWRRPFRVFLTLMALATAIGSVMAFVGVADGFSESFRNVYESHHVDLVVSRQGSADRLSSSLADGFPAQIAGVEGVGRAAGVLLETLSVEDQQIYGIPAMGVRTDSWLFTDYGLSPPPKSADGSEGDVLYLGQNLADRMHAEIGSKVHLFDEPFRVGGTFQSDSIWENGSMILPLAALQRLTGREGQLTYINVMLNENTGPDAIPGVVERVEAIDSKLLALATDEFVETDQRMKLAGSMAWMTSAIALLVGAIGTLNTMMTSVLERTGEIGILRAIGWPTRRVAMIVFLESVILALAATILGGLGAAGLLSLLAASDAAGGLLQPSIAWSVWLRGAMIGLGIGVVGALLPAYRATRLHPTEALRHQG
ncbi:ABC transporter permease [Allorhodopirellula solitaria]|uniref:Macrolide export ATP-binding/permease protein MacB n=1 Tax=Allorhodopirellula solitaria TaxID=2527987 RepID=A0A5C5WME2_9BACT|nr:ABC transporter permease [Allorhodopirellula solitaria]TWT51788.1 Macrolide export ATP-binding/permease protein MacB [Allorhodopirellula solitaria]